MLVFTLMLKGGLYQIMLPLRFLLGRSFCLFVVGKACCVSTGFEGVVIGSLSFVEFFFAAGNVRDSTVDGVG